MNHVDKDEVEVILGCSCHDLEHTIRLCYFRNEPEAGIYIDTLIERGNSFWDRLKKAFFYVFNIKRASGKMDSIILNNKGGVYLRRFMSYWAYDRDNVRRSRYGKTEVE